MMYYHSALGRAARWEVDTGPASEPVTLAEAKTHLRVDHSDEDDLINGLIQAAREYLEGVLGRGLFTQTLVAYYPSFSERMMLPRAAPLASVTSLKYLDEDGAEQTVTASLYTVQTAGEPGEIRRAYGASWPTHQAVPDAVYATYVVGWSATASIPQAIKQALYLLVGHWYENREASSPITVATVPDTVSALVAAYKVRWA